MRRYCTAYLRHFLQENKFLFDCSDTYFSIYNGSLYILSKNLSEFEFRFDFYNLSEKDAKWQQLEAPISLLLRFKNAIVLTNSDTNEECEKVYNYAERKWAVCLKEREILSWS